MAVVGVKSHNVSSGHSQLTRSLERILEEAHFSGELRLSNRKLKDFPKSATKYNLSDTVIADLSRNRFCEVPEDLTTFAFLETLILYHNTIRTIPPSIKGLSSLTYLDLRSNQLSVLPREICFLPLQVLLIANNRLISLPDELGRMERLTDLDASCNQLTNLPTRIGDLRNLRSLSLRNNQLVYLPREITYLLLVELNLSCNRISSLPHEVRHMTTLVALNLENNPLTSPPASLCVRGLVHVFKYLDTQAMKDEKQKSGGGNYDGYTTLRRAARHTNSLMDNCKSRRQHIDSGYSTSDGLDKRWSQDLPNSSSKNDVVIQKTLSLDSKTTITPETNGVVSTIPVHNYKNNNKNMTLSSSTDVLDQNGSNEQFQRKFEKQSPNAISNSNNSDNSTSPEEDFLLENQKSEDKSRNLNIGNIQTYREYKEALKQQRNQEIAAVYRAKEQQSSPDSTDNCSMNVNSNGNGYVNGQARSTEIPVKKIGTPSSTPSPTKTPATTPPTEQQQIVLNGRNSNNIDAISPVTKKPVQKVIPSRVTTPVQYQTCNQTIVNGSDVKLNQSEVEYSSYVKPCSPIKAANGTTCLGKTVSAVPIKPIPATKISSLKSQTSKTPNNRNVSWNHDIPAEKLSFTMRREFDKQKEETELLTQLRTIIESRLKMTLPSDISSALMDGVVLCHLANFVRPRSVASIHVPSPGVPKLTMARCRRNVDNFLEACRKIGVDEELICSCEDVINSEESSDEASQKPNQSAVLRTIGELLKIQRRQQQQQRDQLTLATNANRTDQLEIGEKQELTINGNLFNCVNNNNNNNNNHKNNNGLSSDNEILNSINISANKSKQYDDGNYCNYEVNMDRDPVDIYVEDNEIYSQQKLKNNFHSNILRKEIHFKLNNIQEEDNENEDIGVGNNNKLNCKIDVYDGIVDNHDTTKTREKFNNKSEIVSVNDLNSPTYKRYEFPLLTTNVNIDTPQKNSHKIVNKRIEFYENNCYLISNDKILVESNEKTSLKSEESKIDENYDDVESNGQETFSHDSMAFSIVLSCTFILTFLILILLPLPN